MPERLAFAASRMPNIGSLAEREGAHPPGGNFLLVQKVTKNTLRGFAPKNPSFWNRVVEGFILETISVVGLPTNPRGFATTPAGL